MVNALDQAFVAAESDSQFEASEAYFRRFPDRLRLYLHRVESERAHSELPSALASVFDRTPPGTLPGGATYYFQRFVEEIWYRIKAGGTQDQVPKWLIEALDRASHPTLPVDEAGYFDSFIDRIEERVERGEVAPDWLQRVLSTRPQMPVTEAEYFGEFGQRLRDRISAREEKAEEVPQWLLDALESSQDGRFPSYYEADRLSARVTHSFAEEHPASGPERQPRLRLVKRRETYRAVAAVVALLFAFGAVMMSQSSLNPTLQPTIETEMSTAITAPGSALSLVEPVSSLTPMTQDFADMSSDELEYIIHNFSLDGPQSNGQGPLQ